MDSELYISFSTICSTLNDNILSHIFFNFSQISFVFKFACVCVCVWVEIEVKAICISICFCLFWGSYPGSTSWIARFSSDF